jgi:hypothetical protein
MSVGFSRFSPAFVLRWLVSWFFCMAEFSGEMGLCRNVSHFVRRKVFCPPRLSDGGMPPAILACKH